MRRKVTATQRAEVVALADVVGIEAAAEAKGWDARTVRSWWLASGRRPEIEPDAWEKLHNLSMASTMAAVASGTLPVRTVAVIAGIAARNLRMGRAARPEAEPEPSAEEAQQGADDAACVDLMAWCDALPDGHGPLVKRHIVRSIRESLQRRREGLESEPVDTGASMAEHWAALRVGLAANLADVVTDQIAHEAHEAERTRQRELAQRFLSDDEADLLTAADRYLEEIA